VPVRRVLTFVALVALVSLSLSTGAQPARAGGPTWNYPADCATVQACIDAAGPGDSVFMSADSANENVSITKSVSLKSANATYYKVKTFSFADGATPVVGTLAGIEVVLHLGVFLDSTIGSAVIIRNVVVGGQAGQAASIGVDVETSASVTIERSVARAVGAFGNALSMLAAPEGGQINFRVVGNRFDGHGNSQSGDGIELSTLTSGNLTADFYNNTIWDVARNGFAGIFLSASGTVHADVNVVGNTIERSGADGLQQRNTLASGGALAVDVFNNTFSHAQVFGVRLDNGTAVPTAFRAGFNNYFANSMGNQRDGLSLGSNNLAASPSFVAGKNGNLRLKAGSPLINKGQVCSPGGVANPDADGNHRLFGTTVDIGAFERDGVAPTGLVLIGSNGPNNQFGGNGADILCGYGGDDQQFGGPGNDFVDGGDNNDFIVGSSGADRMLAGKGNDTICADDGAATDFLDGGKGTDKFRADAGDTRKSVEQPAGTACDP
jgi:hypothetical protein